MHAQNLAYDSGWQSFRLALSGYHVSNPRSALLFLAMKFLTIGVF